MIRNVKRWAVVALIALTACGGKAAATDSPDSPRDQFCRDFNGVLLKAVQGTPTMADLEAARAAFVKDSSLPDTRVVAHSKEIVEGLDTLIAFAELQPMADAVRIHSGFLHSAIDRVGSICP